MSYSQHGEDEILLKMFPSFHGHLLDIGAWEPCNLSNSRLLIEHGWDATLVEFSPTPVRQLVQEYGRHDWTKLGGRSWVRVIQAAITPGPEHVMEFEVTDDALSSCDPKMRETWKDAGGYYGMLWVPTLSVQALLDQFFGKITIDVCNVDTEGTSVEVASALIKTDWRPRVLCVEHDNRVVELMSFAQQYGYTLRHTTALNLILSRGL